MKTELSLICGVMVCVIFGGCNKANHESASVSQSQTNTNSLRISADTWQQQINVAGGRLTNAVGEIKEAAGAAASDIRAFTERLQAAVQSDPSFSKDWQNIRLSMEGEKIALSGTVGTEAEHQFIATKAREIIGADKFVDRLQVKPAAGVTAPAPAHDFNQPSSKK